MAHAPEDCTGKPQKVVTIQATGEFSKPGCEKLKNWKESNQIEAIEVAEAETLENIETEVC